MRKSIDQAVVLKLLQDSQAEAMLIHNPYNMRYVSGFTGGEGTIYISEKQRVLITDSRYTEAAGKETDFRVMEANSKNPVKTILTDLIRKDGVREMAFENTFITYAQYQRLCEFYPMIVGWHALDTRVTDLRQIKTEEEIALLRQAEAIGDQAFAHILDILRPGLTELDLKAELEYDMVKHGASGTSFDTIVASGFHSSMPHAVPTNKVIEHGDFVTMDFGCIYQGYCSDMTRTVVIGRANQRQKEIYNLVLQAQTVTERMIHPNMICKEVDKIARDIIRDGGYGDYFGHGLGHSVGLEIHESPACNTRDTRALKVGMIMTVEPGIYIPDFGGVRIEDMGVVTERGYESFAHSPKHLIEI